MKRGVEGIGCLFFQIAGSGSCLWMANLVFLKDKLSCCYGFFQQCLEASRLADGVGSAVYALTAMPVAVACMEVSPDIHGHDVSLNRCLAQSPPFAPNEVSQVVWLFGFRLKQFGNVLHGEVGYTGNFLFPKWGYRTNRYRMTNSERSSLSVAQPKVSGPHPSDSFGDAGCC